MVIERFRGRDPVPVYRGLRERGRLTPTGFEYVASWVTVDLRRCYQVMECDQRDLLDAWMAQWEDLVDFEVVRLPVRLEPDLHGSPVDLIVFDGLAESRLRRFLSLGGEDRDGRPDQPGTSDPESDSGPRSGMGRAARHAHNGE